ncbi:MAG: type II secretion system F family protein [Acidimicrobiia bacterium]
MIALGIALAGALGVHLLWSGLVLGRRSLLTGPRARRRPGAARRRDWLVQAGLGPDPSAARDLLLMVLTAASVTGLIVFAVFGGVLPAVVAAAFGATGPPTALRARRAARRAAAMEAWPRLLEELRLSTSSLGRSIPQALVDVGRRAPEELRPAFAAAEREWLLSTDFSRMVAVLKGALADPTADAACETLLVAHEVGGSDLDQRLAALVEDRIQDAQGRKDARAKQAGARFARRFVLVVPAGMALAGMSVGTGRAAYQSSTGQILVAAAIGMVVVCWTWAGRIMSLPDEQRVFDG